MYYGLKKQLDYLNDMERRGLEDLSITGYVDLYNQTMREVAVTNLKRETEHQIEKIEKSHIIEEKEESVIPKEIVQESVAKENKIKRTRLTKDKIKSTTLMVLKDAGIPLKMSELMKRTSFVLNEKLSPSTFQSHTMPELMNEGKIEKVTRGFYQIKM
jgi:hypothetical protein